MRVVIAHNKEQAIIALAAAASLKKHVNLQSAPDAIFYAGPLYLKEMFEQAQKAYPKVKATFIIDCNDAGAEAIEAMRCGHKTLRSSAPKAVRDKLMNIAAQHGAIIFDENSDV